MWTHLHVESDDEDDVEEEVEAEEAEEDEVVDEVAALPERDLGGEAVPRAHEHEDDESRQHVLVLGTQDQWSLFTRATEG